jgi:hypothetical protein
MLYKNRLSTGVLYLFPFVLESPASLQEKTKRPIKIYGLVEFEVFLGFALSQRLQESLLTVQLTVKCSLHSLLYIH